MLWTAATREALGYHVTWGCRGRKKRVEAKSYPASSREAKGTKNTRVAVGKADWQMDDYSPITSTVGILGSTFWV